MESSTVLAFRIFVMLSCLIIVPMAAIFGSAFPDVVKTMLVDRIVALSTGKTPETPATAPDPNGFREVSPAAEAAPLAQAPGSEAPAWGGAPAPSAAAAQARPSGSPWMPGQVVSAHGNPAPPHASGMPSPGSHLPGAPASAVVAVGGPGNHPGYTQPAGFSAPMQEGRPPVSMASNASIHAPHQLPPAPAVEVSPYQPAAANGLSGGDRTACALEQPDRFKEMERRLREFGATYYLLETWGGSGELYRFHCRMAVANNSSYSRHFEATDRDALKAMADVVSQVEAWRAGPAQ